MDIKVLFIKYKNVIPYLFFGVCTTIVNVLFYWVCSRLFFVGTMESTIIAWILAVSFAYVTNRKWVFHSQAHRVSEVTIEIVSFFVCRLLTGIIDFACMFIFVQILCWNDVLIKFFANVIVIVLNYVASKLVIFKSGKG